MGGALGGCICCFSSSSARSLSCFLFFLFLLGVSAFCCACMLRMEPERHVGIHHTQRNFSPQNSKPRQSSRNNKTNKVNSPPNQTNHSRPLLVFPCLSFSSFLVVFGLVSTHKHTNKNTNTREPKLAESSSLASLGGCVGGFLSITTTPSPLSFLFLSSSSSLFLLLCFFFFFVFVSFPAFASC